AQLPDVGAVLGDAGVARARRELEGGVGAVLDGVVVERARGQTAGRTRMVRTRVERRVVHGDVVARHRGRIVGDERVERGYPVVEAGRRARARTGADGGGSAAARGDSTGDRGRGVRHT